MKRFITIFLSSFVFLAALLAFSYTVRAANLPSGVKPEKGKASGTLGTGDEQLTVTIDFWNVGEAGGSEYGETSVKLGCTQKKIGDWECTADENPPSIGTFSGGPNGVITINGDNKIQLADGKNFTSDLEKTFHATVENPEIFSEYNWDENSGAEESSADEDDTLTIVIPGGLHGFGSKDTKIEVKDGIVDMVVPYQFSDAHIKGTYDSITGKLDATFTVKPHNDGANIWSEINGNLNVDLSEDNTAGFMTISGNMQQWLEGDDKGPPGEYEQRVYYTVENPPEQKAKEKGETKRVNSNLRVAIGTGLNLAKSGSYILRPNSDELIEIDRDTKIYVGDTIVCPAGGRTLPIYQDGYFEHGIVLQPGTNLTITKPAELLSHGEFLYEHVKNPKKGTNEKFDNFEMQLASLKVKIKGTKVVLKEDGKTSSIKVINGLAEVTDVRSGKTIKLGEGKMISSTKSGLGEIQSFDVKSENARWESSLQEINKVSALNNSPRNPLTIFYFLGGLAVLIIIGLFALKFRGKQV